MTVLFQKMFPNCRFVALLCCGAMLSLAGCNGGEKPAGGTGKSVSETAGKGANGAQAGAAGMDARCIKPTPETIADGTYAPLSRPLYLYVNRKSLTRPGVAGFLRNYLGEAQTIVPQVGYIRLGDDILKQSQAALDSAIADLKLPEKLDGRVVIDGSSTVYPISQAIAEEFQKTQPDVKVQVARSGTGGGFKKFVVGETDINGASRPIDKKEVSQCAENKIEYLELKVAIDGISVIVNKENDWCDCITVEMLKTLWEPNSKIEKWSDLNPSWPAEKIQLYGADSDSGTFDFFTEVIVGKAKSSRSDYQASGDDNTLVQGVKGDKYSLGYFGYAYYIENQEELKVLGVIPAEKAKTGEEKK